MKFPKTWASLQVIWLCCRSQIAIWERLPKRGIVATPRKGMTSPLCGLPILQR